MDIILLERINRLGNMGDIVKVKDGFARNFLIPQGKALRATSENKAGFEARKQEIEKHNAEARAAAEETSKTLHDVTVVIVRQASEDGKLYGSVTSRDVADQMRENGHEIERRFVILDQPIKTLGEYSVVIQLHPEVELTLPVHIVRTGSDVEAVAASA